MKTPAEIAEISADFYEYEDFRYQPPFCHYPRVRRVKELCNQRVAWMSSVRQFKGFHSPFWPPSGQRYSPVVHAASLENDLKFQENPALSHPDFELRTWDNLFLEIARQAEQAGILVNMARGLNEQTYYWQKGVDNKTELCLDSLTCLTITDREAPLIFINSALDESARCHALVEGLAKLQLGISSLSNYSSRLKREVDNESAFNEVDEHANKVAEYVIKGPELKKRQLKYSYSENKAEAKFRISPTLLRYAHLAKGGSAGLLR